MKIDDVIYVDVRDDHKTIYEILRYLNEKKYILNLNYNDLTWDITKQSKFIESCLMRIPIQYLYFYELYDGRYSIADGIQRIITLDQFHNNELILSGLILNPKLNGIKFNDLHPKYKNIFEDTTIKFHSINLKKIPENIVEEIIRRIKNIN
jgi:hypothetical protein